MEWGEGDNTDIYRRMIGSTEARRLTTDPAFDGCSSWPYRRFMSSPRVWYPHPMLSFTPPAQLTDAQSRPYFLWDCGLTLDQFRKGLEDPDPEVRAYLVGKLMRQAKPDDVFLFVRPREIRELWPRLTRYLGRTRDFWSWLFETWEGQGRVWR